MVLNIMPFAFIILTAIGTYENRNYMVILMSNLDKTLVAYNFVSKTFIFVIKRQELNILITEIKCSGDKISDERQRLMAMHVIVVTTLSTATVGAFSLLSQLKGELPVEAWIPFNVTKNQMNLFLGLQILAVSFMVSLFRNFAIQGIVCSIVMYFCEQLVDVQNRIKCLKFSKETELQMREEFKEIVKKHVRLMRYSKTFTNILKEFFLIQNLAVTIELCLNAIMVSVVGIAQKTLFASFLSYLCLALLNAYIFCYLGNELIIQSEGIALAAYESEWTSWPIDVQKSLLIIIRMAQKPLSLSAGGMATMCIQTYSQALYNAYSIFAVLNDMVE
ncbi:odorant receptor 4-like [Epargyreus clarus]|uniref:odorant receptor 4-like n=1 Tax=Epargyreus clarus TaxID=520877 RepID=UPI003C2F0BBE